MHNINTNININININKGNKNRALAASSGKLMAMAKRVIVMERFGKMLPLLDQFI